MESLRILGGDRLALNFNDIKLTDREPVYKQISLYVKQQILIGKAVSGDEMPSRRELAAKLSINPNTVQKAYKFMEEEGFLITIGNQGSFIHIDKDIFSKIEEELTYDLVANFISSAKDINLSFKGVIDLVSELWDEL